jgi:hypothetical protein
LTKRFYAAGNAYVKIGTLGQAAESTLEASVRITKRTAGDTCGFVDVQFRAAAGLASPATTIVGVTKQPLTTYIDTATGDCYIGGYPTSCAITISLIGDTLGNPTFAPVATNTLPATATVIGTLNPLIPPYPDTTVSFDQAIVGTAYPVNSALTVDPKLFPASGWVARTVTFDDNSHADTFTDGSVSFTNQTGTTVSIRTADGVITPVNQGSARKIVSFTGDQAGLKGLIALLPAQKTGEQEGGKDKWVKRIMGTCNTTAVNADGYNTPIAALAGMKILFPLKSGNIDLPFNTGASNVVRVPIGEVGYMGLTAGVLNYSLIQQNQVGAVAVLRYGTSIAGGIVANTHNWDITYEYVIV